MAITVPSFLASASATASFAPLPIRCSVHHRTKTLVVAPPPRPLPLAASACPACLVFRLGNAANFHLKRSVPIVFASDSSNTEPTSKGKDDSSSEVAYSPPLPTILAGVAVFLLLCWLVSSIVMWLVGLIVNPPSS